MPSVAHTPKRQRISYACDFCHRRGLKCKTRLGTHQEDGRDEDGCLTCLEHGQSCTRTRQRKKRGTKPRVSCSSDRSDTVTGVIAVAEVGVQNAGASVSATSRGAAAIDRDLVSLLIEVYLDSVHPSFPLYCEREIFVGWRDGSFPKTQAQWTSLTAMCALSMCHVRKGALFKDASIPQERSRLAEELLQDALAMTPVDFYNQRDMDVVRSYGFLALLGVQSKQYALTQKYMAFWHGICGLLSMHDEARWSIQLDECEREVRRRLFWIFYRLEVHMACVTGQIIRNPEAQCNVDYPKGVHHPAFVSGRDGLFEDWFSGWNLTNDLYRLLEHVLVQLRMKNVARRAGNLTTPSPADSGYLHKLDKIQRELHTQFFHVYDRSSDSGRNRCGFQATHILATVHLVRLTALVVQGSPFQDVLATAKDMVHGMQSVPLEYLRAIGPPLLEKLTGVAVILDQLAAKQLNAHEARVELPELIDAIVALFSAVEGTAQDAVETLVKMRDRLKFAQRDSATAPVDLNGASLDCDLNSRLNSDPHTTYNPNHMREGDIDVPSWLLDMAFPMDSMFDGALTEYGMPGNDCTFG